MKEKHVILQGAIILTLAGFATRIIGFFYRIFLSRTIGAEGMGIYQLIFPIYTMCFSFTASGIQTAISRFVSAKMATGDKRGAKNVFLTGLSISFVLSMVTAWLLHHNAGFLSSYFLEEERCESLLRLVAYSIPFASIHACCNGYYYGLRKTNIPAFTQLLEQIVRVASSYILYLIFIEKGIPITPILAVIGMVTEEIVSSLFTGTALVFHFSKAHLEKSKTSFFRKDTKELIGLSTPLTLNRVLLNLLQSVEAIMIPLKLRLFGLSVSGSLSVYGVLTGMALPMILFPSAITAAVSTLLLPTVSEAQSANNQLKIRVTIESTIKYSLILGIFCTGIFLTLGSDMGLYLFDSEMAGPFILILSWICPFLYLGTTLTSVLNGLGKATTTFVQSTLGLVIRILSVVFAVPVFGIQGYLWGLLLSQLLVCFLTLFSLYRECHFSFSAGDWILKPMMGLLIGNGILYFSRWINSLAGFAFPPTLLLIGESVLFFLVYACMMNVMGVLKFSKLH